jgi:hypothetical protein
MHPDETRGTGSVPILMCDFRIPSAPKCGFRMITRTLHWDRGRPARSERAARTARLKLSTWRDPSHLAVLAAGGPPAVPVEELEWSCEVVGEG